MSPPPYPASQEAGLVSPLFLSPKMSAGVGFTSTAVTPPLPSSDVGASLLITTDEITSPLRRQVLIISNEWQPTCPSFVNFIEDLFYTNRMNHDLAL